MSQRMVDAVGVSTQGRHRLDLSQQRKEIRPRVHVDKPGFRPIMTASRMDGIGRTYRSRSVARSVPSRPVRERGLVDGMVQTPPLRKAAPVRTVAPRRVGRRVARGAKYCAAAIILGVVLWLCIESLGFGEIALGLYAAFVLIRRVPSRVTFYGALACLSGIVIAQIVTGGENWVGDNLAVYAFLLLAIGTISLGIEVRRERPEVSDMAS